MPWLQQHVRRASWTRVLACAVTLVAASPWTACAMSLREYQALQQDGDQGRDYATYYLVGVMEGVLYQHNQAVRAGAAATICLNDRRLPPSAASELLTSERRRNADWYEVDMPVELVMANALANVYPCD